MPKKWNGGIHGTGGVLTTTNGKNTILGAVTIDIGTTTDTTVAALVAMDPTVATGGTIVSERNNPGFKTQLASCLLALQKIIILLVQVPDLNLFSGNFLLAYYR